MADETAAANATSEPASNRLLPDASAAAESTEPPAVSKCARLLRLRGCALSASAALAGTITSILLRKASLVRAGEQMLIRYILLFVVMLLIIRLKRLSILGDREQRLLLLA